MIASIRLKNFQSHEDTFIEFCEGVNAIIGLSDSGKSAILRAIRWVLFNRPDGEAFISHWAKFTEVTIVLSTGEKVTRYRSKSENAYYLQRPGEKEEEFKAFGRFQVPTEIQSVLNIDEVNFQSQMDSPFLLSFGPGEVAQVLNKAVNLDIIDSTISNIHKKKLKIDADYKSVLARQDVLEEELKNFEHLDSMEADVLEYEKLVERKESVETKNLTLSKIISEVDQLQSSQRQAMKLAGAEFQVREVLDLVQKFSDLNKEADNLHSLIADQSEKSKSLQSKLPILKAEKEVEEAIKISQERENLLAKKRVLSSLTGEYRLKFKERINAENLVHELSDQFKREMGDSCVLCGNEL